MRNPFISHLYGLAVLIILFQSSCKESSQKTLEVPESTCLTGGMVVSAHPLASQVGSDILEQGGNAFDAAIATQLTLAVVYPRAGNLGGGGFMVYHTAEGASGALDFRERAPLRAERDMYLDPNGDVIPKASTLGHLSVAVPGVVDGLVKNHERFGRLPWATLLQPAIDLAENGFTLTDAEAAKLNDYQVLFSVMNDSDMPFLDPDGNWNEGDSIFLPGLAETLRLIRDQGRAGFYQGRTAELLLAEIQSGNGIISQADLDLYSSNWMESLNGDYRGHEIICMPPPSSGGVALLQLLKGMEEYDLNSLGHNSAASIHLMTELERRVYADRASHLGDPDFHDVPISMLLDSKYISSRNSSIDLTKKTDSESIKKGDVELIESMETTHLSIIDGDGNAVALTTTLNGNYGSKVMVDEAQFFLNNEMDDFSVKPGTPNMYGLIGAEANSIAPSKRMLSSMSPTIVLKNDQPYLILGTPGGSTIITTVFQNILNVIDHGMSIEQSVNETRVHHQWLPDKVFYENGGLEYEVIQELEDLGHELAPKPLIGRVDAILIEEGCFQGIGDPRGDDSAIGF